MCACRALNDSDNDCLRDEDGDGWGDNPDGNEPDAFPKDPTEWLDTDGDGIGDNSDEFPNDECATDDMFNNIWNNLRVKELDESLQKKIYIMMLESQSNGLTRLAL